MMLVIVLGVANIVYARESRPDASAGRPTIDDHWHAAYGFNICGTWYQLDGNLEEVSNGQLINTKFNRTGVHSHDDGVIHWHPYSSAATGENAKIGIFFDNYGVELSDDELKIDEGTTLIRIDDTDTDTATDTTAPGDTTVPGTETTATTTATTAPATTTPADSASDAPVGDETYVGPKEWKEGEAKCGNEPAEISMRVWENYEDGEPTQDLTSSLGKSRVDSDFMVFSIYVTSADEAREKPPWFDQLPALGSADISTEDYLRQQKGTSDTINRDNVTLPADVSAPDDAGLTVDSGVTSEGLTEGVSGDTEVPLEEAPTPDSTAETSVVETVTETTTG